MPRNVVVNVQAGDARCLGDVRRYERCKREQRTRKRADGSFITQLKTARTGQDRIDYHDRGRFWTDCASYFEYDLGSRKHSSFDGGDFKVIG